MAEVAYVFHWPLSEIDALTMDELQAWHDQALRIKRSENKG
jgi:hypothetical protein